MEIQTPTTKISLSTFGYSLPNFYMRIMFGFYVIKWIKINKYKANVVFKTILGLHKNGEK